MVNNLDSGGSSKFLEARKYFYSKTQRDVERIEVFVEDEVDSVFWRCIFDELSLNKLFIIHVLRTTDEFNGKDALISKIGFSSLGPNKLLAIDADYDYIIDNYHPYTTDLRNCSFVLHTIGAYSIENYKIHPHFLRRAIYMCSFCDNIAENIEKMFYNSSIVYYNLFTMHLYLISKHSNFYTQSMFKEDLSKLLFLGETISQKTLDHISTKETTIKNYIIKNYSEFDFNNFVISINNLGVKSSSCWQYMNGHDILEELALKITKPLSSKYRGAYINWVHSYISKEARKKELINKFYNSTGVGNGNLHKLGDRLMEIFMTSLLILNLNQQKEHSLV